ncbi:polysaccharide deacetylase family protein [Anaerovorax odorimutans]|uniref:polysaccharide deacetylase family protein n=1 Tax=Anaerovorax odorimutans TaxID=109327 RepID=UPI00041B6901|nr:polysaccharide deacetylase family protein [Anaerovorax odorimutans]
MKNYKKKLYIAAIILLLLFLVFQLYSIFNLLFNSKTVEMNNTNSKGEIKEEDIVIRNGKEGSNKLTFNCNVDWGEDVIPDMLKIFKEENIKVTFYVSGRWAENNPDLLKKMYAEGHEIQSHGYGHKLCTQVSEETVKDEILKTEAIILDTIGVKTTVFAPPSGDYNESTVAICKELGYKMALWSSDTIDWRQDSTADVIKNRILQKPLDGTIVLMHPKPETVKALPGLIKEIKNQGIEIVPFNKLPT